MPGLLARLLKPLAALILLAVLVLTPAPLPAHAARDTNSYDGNIYAVAFNELQRLWGRSVELILLPTDPLQNRASHGPTDPATYWRGVIPQVVVFNTDGTPVLDETGAVSIDAINAALTDVTGLKPQGDVKLSLSRDVNELNSEIVPSR
jgi:hypothetical protein